MLVHLLTCSFYFLFLATGDPVPDTCITGQCFFSGSRRVPEGQENKSIRILQGNWLGARVDTLIAQLLIQEKLGFPVEIVPVQPNGQNDVFATLNDGTAHVMMECWPFEHVQQIIDFPTVEHDSLLGVIGTTGWYIPTWLAEAVPALATFEGLQNAALVQEWLSTPATGNKAALLNGGTVANPWITGVPDIITALNLGDTVQTVFSADESEDTHVNAIALASDDSNTGVPRLFFFYAPHPAFSEYSMTRINLGTADYSFENTFKAMFGNLRHHNRQAYDLLRNIEISNDIQSGIMGEVAYGGKSETQAVCDWLQNSESIWEDWIPAGGNPPNQECRGTNLVHNRP